MSVEKAIEAIKFHKYEDSINILEEVLLSKSIESNDLIVCYENINKLLMINNNKSVLNLLYTCGKHLKNKNLHEEAISCFETILEYESLDRGTEIIYITWESLLEIGEIELASQYSLLYLNFCTVKKLFPKGLIFIRELEDRYQKLNHILKYKISFLFMSLDNKGIIETFDNIFYLYYSIDKKIYIDALELASDIKQVTPPEANELKQIYTLALFEKIKKEKNIEESRKLRNIFIEHMYILIILNPKESYLYILMTEYSLLFSKKQMGLKSLLQTGELSYLTEGSKDSLESLPDDELTEDRDSGIFTSHNITEITKEHANQDIGKTLIYKTLTDLNDIKVPEQVIKNSIELIDEMSNIEVVKKYSNLTTSLMMMRQFKVVDYLLQRVKRDQFSELPSFEIININYLITVNQFNAKKYHECLALSELALLQLPLTDKEKIHFLYLLADSYYHLLKYKKALSAFRKIKELNSSYRNIRTRIKFLESV